MIYRVLGNDRVSGSEREVWLEANTAADASHHATKRGISSPKVEHIKEQDVPLHQPIIKTSGQSRRSSELLERPVWTIARGVALGLLMFYLILVAIRVVLFMFGVALGSAM